MSSQSLNLNSRVNSFAVLHRDRPNLFFTGAAAAGPLDAIQPFQDYLGALRGTAVYVLQFRVDYLVLTF